MEQAAQTSQTDAAKTTTEFEEFSATNIKNFTKGDFSLNNFFNCLKSERNRLITFILKYHQWPLSKIISPVKLAAAGFYYFNKDVVKCAFCHYTVDNWKKDDVPWLRHEQTNRDCPFVNLTCCGNIPLLVDDEVHTISKPVKYHRRIFKYSNLEKPDYNYQAKSQNRLDTFEKQSWKTNAVEKQNLVEAGFFYTGVNDKVQCFHCGGFLANWQPGDVPKEEHARFFPNCHFMISTYGQTFVEYVQFKNQLIQIREKLTLGSKKDKTDLFYMRSIDYQQFIEIKNSTNLVIKRIGTTSDLRF
ncbi:IAP repeat-containing protein 2, partial [Tyrophagus putrescentiae]